jgi:SOS-response transcriptional repressor LexA
LGADFLALFFYRTIVKINIKNKEKMENILSAKDRIAELLHHYRLKATEFSRKIGLKNVQNIYDILNGGGISKSVANKILDVFPEVDKLWLLSGEGSMFGGEIVERVPYSVPLIPFDAIAGFGGLDNDGVRYEDCERYIVPEFEQAKVEFVIRVSGSSMYPKYSSGDVLACRKIDDILFFQWGKVYVIDSSQGVLVKRIYEHEDKDYVLLVSDNKEKYHPYPIPKSDIRSLSIVVGVIRME